MPSRSSLSSLPRTRIRTHTENRNVREFPGSDYFENVLKNFHITSNCGSWVTTHLINGHAGTYSLLRNAPARLSTTRTGCFHAVTTGSSQRLLDSDGYGGECVCVEHAVDFFALSDYHEGQVQRNRTVGGVDYSCSSAIRIDGVGPAARRPTRL